MNFEQARHNMIFNQLRTWGVLDSQILDLIATIPREQFVPESYQYLAYSDTEIPLGFEQVMLAPKTISRCLQALKITKDDSVLEIGTGTGYLTTLLCNLAKSVHSVEIIPELAATAREHLSQLNSRTLELSCTDGFQFCEKQRHHFDVIVVTGSMPKIFDCFTRSLNVGGRLFAIVGEAPVMSAVIIEKVDKDHWARQSLFETSAPALMQIPDVHPFEF